MKERKVVREKFLTILYIELYNFLSLSQVSGGTTGGVFTRRCHQGFHRNCTSQDAVSEAFVVTSSSLWSLLFLYIFYMCGGLTL